MWFRKLAKQQSGKPISAQMLRDVAEAAEWASRIRADPPLAIDTTGFGPLIRYAGQVFGAYVAVATTTITARSGTTPGTGTAKLLTWNGAIFQPLGGGSPVTKAVFNISGNPSGIASGSYCIILQISGDYFVVTSECAT